METEQINKPQEHERHEWLSDMNQAICEDEEISVHCNFIDCPATAILRLGLITYKELEVKNGN